MLISNGVMARGFSVSLRAMVFVFLAVACILEPVIAEQISEGKDGGVNSVSEIHSVPGKLFEQVAQDVHPVEEMEEEKKGDEKEQMVAGSRSEKLQWSFNLFKPWETFKVARSADEFDNHDSGLRKRVGGCRMWGLLSRLFGHGHHRREQRWEHHHPRQDLERKDRFIFSRPFGHGYHGREDNGEYHQDQHHHDEHGHHHNLFFRLFRLFGHRHHWREHQQESMEHHHQPSEQHQDFHYNMLRKFPHGGFDAGRHIERFENHRPSFPWTGHHVHCGEHRRERLEQERRHFGRKEGIIARAKSYFADVGDRVRGWVAPAFERKPPTIQSASEPLEMNKVQMLPRTEQPCQLQEKLAAVIVPALKEVGKNSLMVDKESTSEGVVHNLRKMLGHEMQIEIQKQVCEDVGALSHRQKFCKIFHSNPEIGVLMAFSKLHIDPLEAAIYPKDVANRVESFRNIQKVHPLGLFKGDHQLLKQVNEALGLGQMVYDAVRAFQVLQNKGIGENEPDFKDRDDTFSTKVEGREGSSCEVCLQQKIRQIKRTSEVVTEDICEGFTDAPLAAACDFVDKNDYIANTMFAYKYKIWKLAAHMCENQISCDFYKAKSGNNFEKEGHKGALKAGYLMEDSPKAPFVNLDVNNFHHPRILEIRHQIFNTEAPHHFGRRNFRNCAMHHAEMLRGNKLDFLSAELEKAHEAMVEFHMHPSIIRIQSMPFEFHPMESALDLPMILNQEAWEEGKDIEGIKLRHTGMGEAFGSEESVLVISDREHLSGAEKLEEEAAEMEDGVIVMDENLPVKEINHAEM